MNEKNARNVGVEKMYTTENLNTCGFFAGQPYDREQAFQSYYFLDSNL